MGTVYGKGCGKTETRGRRRINVESYPTVRDKDPDHRNVGRWTSGTAFIVVFQAEATVRYRKSSDTATSIETKHNVLCIQERGQSPM